MPLGESHAEVRAHESAPARDQHSLSHLTPMVATPMTDLTDERRALLVAWGGGVLALLIGILLFTRFSIEGNLWRDEAIYAYGGQQLADGVPVYLGIFDPKPPLPTFLTALGALAGRAAGKDELIAMRAEFFVWALLAVVAVYWLGPE